VSLMISRLAAVNERIKATRALPDQDRAAWHRVRLGAARAC
jgi:hypothetical protein